MNTLYWPWMADILIALFSIISIVYFGNVAITNPTLFDFWASFLSIFPLLYSTNSALKKINEDRKQRDNFERGIGPFWGDCQNIIVKHLPDSLSSFPLLEKKLIETHFDDWKKFKNIPSIEYQLLDTLMNNLVLILEIVDSERLFLQYMLVTSSFPLHFPKLITEIKDGDYYTEGSPYNIFIRLLHEFMKSNTPLSEISAPDIDDTTIESTLNICLNTNFSSISDLIKEQEARQKIEYLLGKCFENAYTNAGNLNLPLQDDAATKLVFLYKYDERFSILKRVLNQAIKDHVISQTKSTDNPDELIDGLQDKLSGLTYPLPLSKALADFDWCIEKLTPRERFAFVIYPDKFGPDSPGWSAQRFMEERVLPRAQEHQDIFNKRLVKEFPYLKSHQKKTLDANYYMFEFNRGNFSYHATQDAIPRTIKKLLIRDILDSEKSGDIVASQLVYLKQVINNLSISGLLFTEDKTTQERIRKFERRLIRSLKKQDLNIENIYDVISIGNQIDQFIASLHGYLHDVELKRRSGKKYQETQRLAHAIVRNAQDIVEVFNSFQVSKNA